MPVFLLSLIGGLVSAAGSFVGRILIALSVGYVTYQGISLLLDNIEILIFQSFNGLDSQVRAVMGLLQIGSAISVTLSAIAARLILNGLTGGKMTKAVIK